MYPDGGRYGLAMPIRTFDHPSRRDKSSAMMRHDDYYLPRSRTLVAMEPSVLAKEAEEKERKREAQPVIEGLI
jgi:hypothetical protein